MHWLYQNIAHITTPLSFLLGLFAALGTLYDQRRKKQGRPITFTSGHKIAFVILFGVLCVLGGVLLVHSFI